MNLISNDTIQAIRGYQKLMNVWSYLNNVPPYRPDARNIVEKLADEIFNSSNFLASDFLSDCLDRYGYMDQSRFGGRDL